MTSCKDYDDDINNLQAQIDDLNKTLASIEAQIKNGAVITSLTPVSNGVTLTLSNGQSYTITNGKDGADGKDGAAGKDGITWTIGDDGYWYKNGVKQPYKAVGEKGEKGDKGDAGDAGASAAVRYYVPNPVSGYFDIYENGKKVESTKISYLGKGVITAVLKDEALDLYGVQGAASDPTTISLNGKLSSLVFIPNLYWDGIESVEYPWITDTLLSKHVTGQGFKSRATNKNASGSVKDLAGLDDYTPNLLPHDPIAVTPVDTTAFGPAWGVEYHLNPTNANVLSSDVKGYNVLNPTIIETRAVAASSVTSPSVDAAGAQLFNISPAGILTAGLQIADPWKLSTLPTAKTYTQQNLDANTIALQVKTDDPEKPIVTSDYAMLLPSKVYLEGLAWAKAPMYKCAAPDLVKAGITQTGRLGDELGTYDATEKVHIWDSPKEALQDKNGAALECYYNGSIDLKPYMSIHAVKEDIKTGKSALVKWAYGEEAVWGLKYEFKLVNYSVDDNTTGDSKYATIKDGVVTAVNVNAAGEVDPQSKTAIDREPLVQVIVKDHKGRVVLDGYVLIHITDTPPEGKDNKTITDYPVTDNTFDLCNAMDVLSTNWSQFNKYILTDGLDNMTKEKFDELYEADLKSPTQIGTQNSGDGIYEMKVFKDAPAKGLTDPTEAPLGTVSYYPNTNGTTNHRFIWTLTENEMEALTHDTKTPVNVVRYVRFKAKAGKEAEAPYAYVYVKMEINLTRKPITSVKFGDKITNYWFADNGADGGKDAIALDVQAPRDDQDINTISHAIRANLVGNTEKITDAHKYYFVPDQTTSVTAQNGKVYTITPMSSATDVAAKSLYCLRVTAPRADVHEYNRNTLDKLLNECTIDYTKGAFANNKLYAVSGGVYTQIATLNQNTGVITLINNVACQDVLNAVGYAEKHANIAKEFNTFVGVASQKDCAAQVVEDDIFRVSWQRPINLKELGNTVALDAKTNENVIYVLDFLKLFDWRGEKVGYMWDDQTWFWAYYNIKAITLNMNPDDILTTLHQTGDTFVPLSSISTMVELSAYPSRAKASKKYSFTLYPTYDKASKNQDLLDYMKANKAAFGAIYYANNGDNVTKFKVKIPVKIEYEWGYMQDVVTIEIDRTRGN